MRCRTTGFGEWPRLSKVRRFEYLFPTAVLGHFDGALLVLVLVAVMDLPSQVKLFMWEMVILFMVLPWAPYFIGGASRIGESVARLERHKVFGDTDEFILSA
jgi:hypothetical protein